MLQPYPVVRELLLSEAERKFYREEGCLRLGGLVDPGAIDELREEITKMSVKQGNEPHLMKKVFAFVSVLLLMSSSVVAQQVQHGVVYSAAGTFAGWPANEGFWMWGDEVLVGFEASKFSELKDTHNVDRNASKRIAFARSKDGGSTWAVEEHQEIAPPAYLENPGLHIQTHPKINKPIPCLGGINFTNPGFAMKLRGSVFYTSNNRGNRWQGPYRLPAMGQELLMARTNYLVTSSKSCRVFLSSAPLGTGAIRGNTFMAETTDGGKSFEFVAWVAKDNSELLKEQEHGKASYSIMPSVVCLEGGTLVAGVRQRANRKKWVGVYDSKDDGKTWNKISTVVQGASNPVALVSLGGQRLAAVYGWRQKPFGIRAKISNNGGKTWSQPIVLRDDGLEWDLGYVRAGLRPDGKLLAVYYYTTAKRREQHIAYTIWDLPDVDTNHSKKRSD